MEVLSGITLVLVIFIAWAVYQANVRLHVIDLRLRVLEKLAGRPELEAKSHEIYKEVFGQIYSRDYDRLVKFGRKNDLMLPLPTSEEWDSQSKQEFKRESLSD